MSLKRNIFNEGHFIIEAIQNKMDMLHEGGNPKSGILKNYKNRWQNLKKEAMSNLFWEKLKI